MSDELPSNWKKAALGELLGDEFGLELCEIINGKNKGKEFLVDRLKEFLKRKDVASRLKKKGTDPDYLAYCIEYMFIQRNIQQWDFYHNRKGDDKPCLPPHSQN